MAPFWATSCRAAGGRRRCAAGRGCAVTASGGRVSPPFIHTRTPAVSSAASANSTARARGRQRPGRSRRDRDGCNGMLLHHGRWRTKRGSTDHQPVAGDVASPLRMGASGRAGGSPIETPPMADGAAAHRRHVPAAVLGVLEFCFRHHSPAASPGPRWWSAPARPARSPLPAAVVHQRGRPIPVHCSGRPICSGARCHRSHSRPDRTALSMPRGWGKAQAPPAHTSTADRCLCRPSIPPGHP